MILDAIAYFSRRLREISVGLSQSSMELKVQLRIVVIDLLARAVLIPPAEGFALE
jgi:hypothetical protein